VSNINQQAVDIYTLAHAGWGAAAFRAGLDFPAVIAASLVFEYLLEPELKRRRPDVFPWPSQDTRINSAVDTVAVAAGWWLARRTGCHAVISVAAILTPLVVDPAMRRLVWDDQG
jgi:hypothetical protein